MLGSLNIHKKGGRLFNYGTLPTTSSLWVGYFDMIVLVFLYLILSLSSEIFATTYPNFWLSLYCS